MWPCVGGTLINSIERSSWPGHTRLDFGIDTTKSDKVRTLDLTDDALKVLADWTALTGVQEDGALVFPHPEQDTLGRTRAEKGSYLIPSTIVRVLRAGMDKASVPRRSESAESSETFTLCGTRRSDHARTREESPMGAAPVGS